MLRGLITEEQHFKFCIREKLQNGWLFVYAFKKNGIFDELDF